MRYGALRERRMRAVERLFESVFNRAKHREFQPRAALCELLQQIRAGTT